MTTTDHNLFTALTVIVVVFTGLCAALAARLDAIGADTAAALVLAGIAGAGGAIAVALVRWWRADAADDARPAAPRRPRRYPPAVLRDEAPAMPPLRPGSGFAPPSPARRVWSTTGELTRAGGAS